MFLIFIFSFCVLGSRGIQNIMSRWWKETWEFKIRHWRNIRYWQWYKPDRSGATQLEKCKTSISRHWTCYFKLMLFQEMTLLEYAAEKRNNTVGKLFANTVKCLQKEMEEHHTKILYQRKEEIKDRVFLSADGYKLQNTSRYVNASHFVSLTLPNSNTSNNKDEFKLSFGWKLWLPSAELTDCVHHSWIFFKLLKEWWHGGG